MKKAIAFLLIIGIVFFIYSKTENGKRTVKTATKKTGFAQTDIQNSSQLAQEIVSILESKVTIKDTLFLVTTRMLGVCGNEGDPQSELSKKAEEIKYNLENPFFIDTEKAFEGSYTINKKVIVTGKAFDENFSSYKINFKKEFSKTNLVYDIQFLKIEEKKVEFWFFETDKYENKTEMTLIFENGKWQINTL
jgi:hypothetical protein